MGGPHYSIHDNKSYFLTCTVVEWIDVFTRKNHKDAIIESLTYCQEQKGLNIFAWCLMPSHLHMLVNTNEPFQLADVIRDFKKFISKKIISQIKAEPESRREWLLEKFSEAGRRNNKIKYYKFWQDGNHAIEIYSEEVTWQKIEYIHNNPVEEGIVSTAEDYLMSSARNYAGLENLLPVICLHPPVRTIR
jgi:putative transposase